MSAERACFRRRGLRASLGTRTSRRSGTKTLQIRRSRGGSEKAFYRTAPATRLRQKIREIRRTCDCEAHRRMREEQTP